MENVTMMLIGEGLAALFGAALLYANHLLKMKRMKRIQKAMLNKVMPRFFEETRKFTNEMMEEIPSKTMEMTKKMMTEDYWTENN